MIIKNKNMHVLLLFIDGFGLGEADSAKNPLARFHSSFFHSLLQGPLTKECGRIVSDHFSLIPADATLGVAGLPQSATGQTTLLTGVNAAQRMGRHVSAFPGPQLAKIIAAQGILLQLVQRGYSVTSANAYLDNYFQLVASRKRRHSATTLAILGAGLALRSGEDIKNGQAVYQDITNELLPSLGRDDIPVINPWQAGINLGKLVRQHNFTLYEYFQTDRSGHKQDWLKAETIVKHLDGLLCGFWQECHRDCTLILTSDHGNFEDFSVKTHTLNQVPVLIAGNNSGEIARQITDLASITPAILSVMQEGAE